MINVARSSMPDFEEYCEEIKKLWESHWLTNMGEEHEYFQKALENYFDCPNMVLFVNGHLALESAIAAMDFPKGSEVITTPFTFVSTTHAIVRNGLTPVFCDINADDYTIDADKIENLITEKTVAILPVHVYGHVCAMEKIEAIARNYHLKVIYDAAHAFGVKVNGKSIANFGDATMFSFHATKVFHSIEGGAVCTDDAQKVEILENLKNFGIRGPESCVYIGGNAKMNEFQAAMGLCNLRHIDDEIQKRRKVSERYRQLLSGIEEIIISEPQKNIEPNYAYFPVVFGGQSDNRDRVFEALYNQGILARKYFYPLTTDLECYADYPTADSSLTPVARDIANRVLTLPIYADLDLETVEKICQIIKETLTINEK